MGLLFLGWSSQCLQDWGPFFSLAVPSMLMVCIEWWAYEIGSFVMGTWTGTSLGTVGSSEAPSPGGQYSSLGQPGPVAFLSPPQGRELPEGRPGPFLSGSQHHPAKA